MNALCGMMIVIRYCCFYLIQLRKKQSYFIEFISKQKMIENLIYLCAKYLLKIHENWDYRK